MAPTFGPINAALPTRAGATNWGPEHHLHVRSHLGHGANWGLFGEDLPDEANVVTLSSTLTDSSGIPAPEIHYKVSENSRRLLDFHIEKASESLRRSRRPDDRGGQAHALLRLAPAGDRAHGR